MAQHDRREEKPSEVLTRRDFVGGAAAIGLLPALPGFSGRAIAAETPRRGGHLIIGCNGAGAGDSLDPGSYLSTHMEVLGLQFYNTLTEVDEKLRIQPALAESWEVKPGAKEWIFKIRQGVTFHNGKTLTGVDVVHSLNHHRTADSKSAAKSLLTSIVDIRANKNEVTIVLEGGNSQFPYILSDFHLCVGPENTNFKDGIGTGAFILESFEPGVRGRAKRNPNHWRSDRGFVDSVETLALNDTTARIGALVAGAVHVVNKVDPKVTDVLRNNNQVKIFESAGTGLYSFPMRVDMSPFNDKDLRLALKYAVDRQALVDRVLLGHGTIGNDHPVSALDPMFSAGIAQRVYDPDKARSLFKKSGYSGPIVLSASDGAFPGAVDAAQIIQANAASAGISLDVERVPADGYWKNVWRQKPFCASQWNGRPTADLILTTVFKSDSPYNETYWNRPEFDKLLVDARAELDEKRQKQMYHDIQNVIHEEGGDIMPMFFNTIDAGSTKLRGFVQLPVNQMCNFRVAERVWFAE